MPYIGTSPSNGVRRKHTYTATASQTSFSGAGAEGATLSYNDSNFVDVYQNGVKLSEADYTSTSGTAIVLAQGASVSDIVEVVVFDVFSVADTVSKADGGTFDGNVTMAGTHTVTGVSILNGGIDVAGDFNFDVGGGDITLKDDGTSVANIGMESGSFIVNAPTSDTDIIFKGNDGGSAITALTLDMSDAGAATFNSEVRFTSATVNSQLSIFTDGSGAELDNNSGNFTIDTPGDIILDADGGNWRFKDAGTSILDLSRDSNTSIGFFSAVSDMDILFKGNDGGSTITALTLDMSANGKAFFSDSVALNDGKAFIVGDGGNLQIYHIDGDANHIYGQDAHPIVISTTGYERARILGPSTSHSGFFKISDAGSYQGSTGGYHEIRSSSSNEAACLVTATHASYAGNTVRAGTNRAANSGFNLIEGSTNNFADTEFKARGDGEVFADGSFNSGGADYAEMFEWKDGNTSSEDRVGKTVVLDGNQVRLSTSDDAQATIIGVVSARPVVLGDAQSEKWKDKYQTDSYGRYVFEEYTQTEWTVETNDGAKELKSYQTDMIPSDVTVPDDAIVTSKDENGDTLKRRKLNTAFDASKTYIPREDRKEFSAIGLVGKLRVNVGQTVGDRWIKMREISDTVHEYLVR